MSKRVPPPSRRSPDTPSEHEGPAAPAPARPAFRPDGDALRGIAILAVLVFHAVPRALPGGFAGVDVFFVLSGYLVGRIVLLELHAGGFSLGTFYARRARRILPALLLVLGATTLAGARLLRGGDLSALGAQVAASALFANNLLSWAQAGYFETAAAWKPLHHLWSLGVEEQFYLLFPALAWLLARRTPRLLPLVLGALAIASLLACVVATAEWPDAAFFLPLTRMWELLAGVLVGLAELRGWLPRGRAFGVVAPLVGLGALAVAFVALGEGRAYPGARAGLPVLGAALLLAAGPGARATRLLAKVRPLSMLGRVSYPAYLWHWPLLVLARHRANEEPTPTTAVALSCVAIALAAATERWIEAPIRHGRFARAPRVPAILMGALGLVALVATVGTRAFAKSGARARLERFETFEDGRAWRGAERCFLALERGERLPFGEACHGGPVDARPLVVLWGDSHAAHLWPALQAETAARGLRLAQYTAGGCPGLLPDGEGGVHRGACRDIQADALARVVASRPALVVLSARWRNYPDTPILTQTRDLARHLRASGVGRVVVIGATPEWFPTLRSVLLAEMDERGLAEPPLMTARGTPAKDAPIEATLATLAAAGDFELISALPRMCSGAQCRTRVEPAGVDPIFFDAHHFTPDGARWFVAGFADALFSKLRPEGVDGVRPRAPHD